MKLLSAPRTTASATACTPARIVRLTALALGLAAGLPALSGCAALFIGGAAVGGAMMATDRRTSAAQIEDQSIEFKARDRIKGAIGDRGHVNVYSYNRVALITGEIESQADSAAVEAAVAKIEGVRSTVNELAEMPKTSLRERSADTVLSTKVKATIFDTTGTAANRYRAVVERGIVYLMGRVTDAEANKVTELVSSVPGVQKVVRVFEMLTEDELAQMMTRRR